MLDGVEERLVMAANHLPDSIAKKVKGRLIHR
jgi:hypothetical protein